MSISVFIADDEPLARERIKRLLEDESEFHLCGTAENGAQALEQIQMLVPDIVLLDIRMPGEDGLEVAEQLAKLTHPPAIIFCTAYDEYALQAFKHQAIGYLLKPASKKELLAALDQAKRVNQLQLKQVNQKLASSETESEGFVAHSWQGKELIPISDIFCFQADHKYVTVHHTRGETVTDHTLKELEERFGQKFLRVHRNSLVNAARVIGLVKSGEGYYQVTLKDSDLRVQVSRRHVSDLKQFIDSNTR